MDHQPWITICCPNVLKLFSCISSTISSSKFCVEVALNPHERRGTSFTECSSEQTKLPLLHQWKPTINPRRASLWPKSDRLVWYFCQVSDWPILLRGRAIEANCCQWWALLSHDNWFFMPIVCAAFLVSTGWRAMPYFGCHDQFIENILPWSLDIRKWRFWLATAFTEFNALRLPFVGIFDI